MRDTLFIQSTEFILAYLLHTYWAISRDACSCSAATGNCRSGWSDRSFNLTVLVSYPAWAWRAYGLVHSMQWFHGPAGVKGKLFCKLL